MVEDEAHAVLEASTGAEALEIAQRSAPDLVLLDVVMPGMDGFETTRRLKQEGGDVFLPVVLVTALSDAEARLRGLEAGADDFLTKPIDRAQILPRVRNLIGLRDRELRLRERNLDLLELIRSRDDMSSLLVHDLKNPMMVVQMCLTHLASSQPRPRRPRLPPRRPPGHRAGSTASSRTCSTSCGWSRGASRSIVRRPAPPICWPRWPRRAVPSCASGPVHVDLAGRPGPAGERRRRFAHARVIENVVDNSLRHVPVGGRIVMKAEARGDVATITIGNDGPPVPSDMRETIFEKYARGENAGRTNLGLGLYFCRLAVEAHGGRMWVSDEPLPAVFALRAPPHLHLSPPEPGHTDSGIERRPGDIEGRREGLHSHLGIDLAG